MKKKEKKELDVVFILDKSGSMSGSEDATISSYNEYLEREKKNSYEANITTILFSDSISYLYENIPVAKVKKLTHREYVVGGCTALYDALGNSILRFENSHSKKVLFIIITDGYENASREFSKDKIRNLIHKHSEWEFVYVGADIDSYAAGSEIGICDDNIANFKKDRKGLSKLFRAFGDFECAMMEDSEPLSKAHWKEDLEEYLETNQN